MGVGPQGCVSGSLQSQQLMSGFFPFKKIFSILYEHKFGKKLAEFRLWQKLTITHIRQC